MEEKIYWLGFSTFPGVGPMRFRRLLETFNNAKNAWEANEKDLEGVLGKALTEKFIIFKQEFSLSDFAKRLETKHISYLLLKDSQYPKLLKESPIAPFVLYVKGKVDLVSSAEKTIAVVGTRKYTSYGKEVTKLLTQQLVQNDFVIVSGLAIGVDSIAHQTTLESNGRTIAVLGCGVDCCNPASNLPIYDRILQHSGAIVSESAFGNASIKGLFPSRNRIIAGLSLGVLVTEGAEDSGALITAQRAKELHRPIFAVPGPITSQLSIGPHSLLQEGAVTVTHVHDIVRTLGFAEKPIIHQNIPKADSSIEQLVIDLLVIDSLHFDEIVRNSQKDSATIAATLSILEVKGKIRSLSDGRYSL